MTNCRNSEHVPSMTWRYDPETQVIQSESPQWCVEAVAESQSLKMAVCDPNKKEQKWEFAFVNKKKIAEEFPPFGNREAL